MSSRGGPSIEGNRSWRMPHDLVGLIDAQRGLGEVAQVLGVGDLDRAGLGGRLHQDRALGRLAARALDLFMSRMADQHDRAAVLGEPAGLDVHLRDERAGGVDHLEIGVPPNWRRPAVRPRVRTAPPRRPRAPRSLRRRRSRPWTRGRARRAGCARSACARRPARRAWRALARRRRPRAPRRRNSLEGPRAARCPRGGGVRGVHGSMVAGTCVDPPGYDLGSRFGCRMSVGSPRVVGHDTDRSGPLLPGATMRNLLPRVGVRMPACAREPGLGRPRSCDRSHRDGYRPTGGDVRTHDLPRGRRRSGEEFTAQPDDLSAAASSAHCGGDSIYDVPYPSAPPLPGRAALTAVLLIVPAASHAGAATPGAGYSEVPRKICPIDWREGTWHVKKLIRCAAARWTVPGGASKALAIAEPRVQLPAPRLQQLQRGQPASIQHLRRYWPGRAGAYGFRGWSAFNARANIMVTMRMVHRMGGWGPWGASYDGPHADRTARAGQPQHQAPHLVQRGGHHGGPGRVMVRHDPHPREPLPGDARSGHRTAPNATITWGRSASIWSKRSAEVGRARRELPLRRHRGALQRHERSVVGRDAQHLQRPAHHSHRFFHLNQAYSPSAEASDRAHREGVAEPPLRAQACARKFMPQMPANKVGTSRIVAHAVRLFITSLTRLAACATRSSCSDVSRSRTLSSSSSARIT